MRKTINKTINKTMRKTIFALLTAVLTVGTVGFAAIQPAETEAGGAVSVVRVGDQDFTLVNKTGIEIYSVYVSPNNEDEWGEDVLGRDTLASGESVDIEFSRKETAKMWDIRIDDKAGESIEWDKFNLLEISKVTLYYKNGKATADVE